MLEIPWIVCFSSFKKKKGKLSTFKKLSSSNYSLELLYPNLFLWTFSPVSLAYEYLLALLWDYRFFEGRIPFCSLLSSVPFFIKALNKYLLNELWGKQLKNLFLSYMSVLCNIKFINVCFIYVPSLFCSSQPNFFSYLAKIYCHISFSDSFFWP